MIEVGVRELKARLSYYLQLMQAGEEIAIKMRHKVIGYLSKLYHSPLKKKRAKKHSRRELEALIDRWKQEGFLVSGGPYRYRPIKPIKMTPGPTSTEMIRQMRDED